MQQSVLPQMCIRNQSPTYMREIDHKLQPPLTSGMGTLEVSHSCIKPDLFPASSYIIQLALSAAISKDLYSILCCRESARE